MKPTQARQQWLSTRVKPPVGIVLGSPTEVGELVSLLSVPEVVCYQMDLYQAQRLREELATRQATAQVVTAPDLWELPPFQTLLYPAPRGGERGLKLDLIEQAFHALRPQGQLAVLSPYDQDHFFPEALKKVFRRVQNPGNTGELLVCQRQEDRPRRRHEMVFHVSRPGEESLSFVSRPGVFAYGRFDEGARALVETMDIQPGERILDLGCGCGTNGIIAGQRSGPAGFTVMVDSNVRAVALSELNARGNGLAAFQAVASPDLSGLSGGFNVILANPPYYAYSSIARLFIEGARRLGQEGGRFYLVTRQPDQVGPLVAEILGTTTVQQRRGYTILCATLPRPDGGSS